MLLTRVTGTVVTPRKDAGLHGLRLKVVEVLDSDFEATGEVYVAADPLGVAEGQLVFTASGSSGRKADGLADLPLDLVIVGVVERASRRGELLYEQP